MGVLNNPTERGTLMGQEGLEGNGGRKDVIPADFELQDRQPAKEFDGQNHTGLIAKVTFAATITDKELLLANLGSITNAMNIQVHIPKDKNTFEVLCAHERSGEFIKALRKIFNQVDNVHSIQATKAENATIQRGKISYAWYPNSPEPGIYLDTPVIDASSRSYVELQTSGDGNYKKLDSLTEQPIKNKLGFFYPMAEKEGLKRLIRNSGTKQETTLTGSRGIGKTTLALQVLAELEEVTDTFYFKIVCSGTETYGAELDQIAESVLAEAERYEAGGYFDHNLDDLVNAATQFKERKSGNGIKISIEQFMNTVRNFIENTKVSDTKVVILKDDSLRINDPASQLIDSLHIGNSFKINTRRTTDIAGEERVENGRIVPINGIRIREGKALYRELGDFILSKFNKSEPQCTNVSKAAVVHLAALNGKNEYANPYGLERVILLAKTLGIFYINGSGEIQINESALLDNKEDLKENLTLFSIGKEQLALVCRKLGITNAEIAIIVAIDGIETIDVAALDNDFSNKINKLEELGIVQGANLDNQFKITTDWKEIFYDLAADKTFDAKDVQETGIETDTPTAHYNLTAKPTLEETTAAFKAWYQQGNYKLIAQKAREPKYDNVKNLNGSESLKYYVASAHILTGKAQIKDYQNLKDLADSQNNTTAEAQNTLLQLYPNLLFTVKTQSERKFLEKLEKTEWFKNQTGKEKSPLKTCTEFARKCYQLKQDRTAACETTHQRSSFFHKVEAYLEEISQGITTMETDQSAKHHPNHKEALAQLYSLKVRAIYFKVKRQEEPDLKDLKDIQISCAAANRLMLDLPYSPHFSEQITHLTTKREVANLKESILEDEKIDVDSLKHTRRKVTRLQIDPQAKAAVLAQLFQVLDKQDVVNKNSNNPQFDQEFLRIAQAGYQTIATELEQPNWGTFTPYAVINMISALCRSLGTFEDRIRDRSLVLASFVPATANTPTSPQETSADTRNAVESAYNVSADLAPVFDFVKALDEKLKARIINGTITNKNLKDEIVKNRLNIESLRSRYNIAA